MNQASQLSELSQLKTSYERIIGNQRKEIEDLKRHLSFTTQLTTQQPHDDTGDSPVEVLAKLHPLADRNKDSLEIEDCVSYSINLEAPRSKKSINPSDTSEIHSWISIIMLDPKLSGLWSRINNMQRIYHMYKSAMVKRHANSRITEIDFTSPGPACHMQNTDVSTACPVSAGSTESMPKKCPVVSCDLNFMNESMMTIPKVSSLSAVKPVVHEFSTEGLDEFTKGGIRYTKMVQEVWRPVVHSLRANKPLNSTQLQFLLDFYFNQKTVDTSRDLTVLFKDEIDEIYISKNGRLILNMGLAVPGEDDAVSINKFLLKGVYVCILMLIVEESLDILKSSHQQSLPPDVVTKFQALFPDEVRFAGLSYNGSQNLNAVQKYLDNSCSSSSNFFLLNRSLVTLTCRLLLLDRDIMNNGREGNERGETERAIMFKTTLAMVFDLENPIQIWKQPTQIVLPGNDSKKKVKDIRMHACFLWNELIRCLNIVSSSLVSFSKSDRELQALIGRAHSRVEEVQVHGNHMRYLQGLKSPHLDKLSSSLQVNYLLSNVHLFFARGVSNLLGVKLTMKDLDDLTGECGSWIDDERLKRLAPIIEWESKIMLHFSNIYTTYVMFLQVEESKLEKLKESLISTIFVKIDGYFKLSNHILDQTLNKESQYIYNALSECFVSVMQILVALLLRVCSRPKEKNEDLVKQLSTFCYSTSKSSLRIESDIFNLIKNQLSNSINNTLRKLNNAMTVNKNHSMKLNQLWVFYSNLLESSRRFYSSYNKVHANIPGFNKLMNTNSPIGDFSKCPVAHIPAVTKAPGRCPIDYTQFMKSYKRKSSGDSPHHQEPMERELKRLRMESDSPKSTISPTDSNGFIDRVTQSYMDDDLINSGGFDFDINFRNFSSLDIGFLSDSFEALSRSASTDSFNYNIEESFQ
ncbi:hypothetical protein PSN45_000535 [Yamadazyma tenuis]|nr:hypothetical protein PSN45_000535 [Yamadazyma tenuis]